MRRSDPDPREPVTEGTEGVWLSWNHQMPSGGTFAHQVVVYPLETATAVKYSQFDLARLACHVVLDWLPDEALREVCNKLAELHRDYTETTVVDPTALPQVTEVRAKRGSDYTQPEFSIVDD